MRAIRLKARRRIGMKIFRVVYSKSIKRSSGHASGAGKVSTGFLRQLLECGSGLSAAIFSPLTLQDNVDAFRLWRPNAEMRPAFADQFRPDRVAALDYCIRSSHSFDSRARCGREFLSVSRVMHRSAQKVIELRAELSRVDRVLRLPDRAMIFASKAFGATLPSSAERSIHLTLQLIHCPSGLIAFEKV